MGKDCLNILVIEDSKKHAEEIVKSYDRVVKAIEERNLLKEYLGPQKITIEWVKGTKQEIMRNDDTFLFYDDTLYSDLRKRLANVKRKNIRIGILLDVSLSREEYEKASVNDYSGFTMARKIYEDFHAAAGIYIITSIREFSSQVLRLMGTQELVSRYVSKDLITEYPSYGVIARTIRYMFCGEILSERREDEIDCLLMRMINIEEEKNNAL